jgi:hypothetical protein
MNGMDLYEEPNRQVVIVFSQLIQVLQDAYHGQKLPLP